MNIFVSNIFLYTLTLLLFLSNTSLVNADSHNSLESSFFDIHKITNIGEKSSKSFIAVTANSLATDAAYEILEKDGSAVDAAIAAQFVLNLVEPQSSGIGGGAFMMYWEQKNSKLFALDGREMAPSTADQNYFRKSSGTFLSWRDARLGGRAVGVPGTLHLLKTAHQSFGVLPWVDLFTPAIRLATDGFAVSPRLANSIKNSSAYGILNFDETYKYLHKDSKPMPVGETLINPNFAKTLSAISSQGIGIFYGGKIGEQIIEALKNTSELPAIMSLHDLKSYQTKWRSPLCTNYKDYKICGIGPPSSGMVTMGQILGILENFNLENYGYTSESIHLILEASRLAFADRNRYIADPDFVSVPTLGLLDKQYLKQRSDLIRSTKALEKVLPGKPIGIETLHATVSQKDNAGTSHLSIVDSKGNIASMTTTIESGFGSGLMIGGFLLNNEMTDFAITPSLDNIPVANRVQGSKRPRSSMAPTIIFDKKNNPVLVLGSPGGSRIICYVTSSIINIVDWKMTPQQAVEMPHFCNRNGISELESNFFADSLDKIGHEVKIRKLNSGLHIIQILGEGSYLSGVDPRREGSAKGKLIIGP